jgi:hypothetical protein
MAWGLTKLTSCGRLTRPGSGGASLYRLRSSLFHPGKPPRSPTEDDDEDDWRAIHIPAPGRITGAIQIRRLCLPSLNLAAAVFAANAAAGLFASEPRRSKTGGANGKALRLARNETGTSRSEAGHGEVRTPMAEATLQDTTLRPGCALALLS